MITSTAGRLTSSESGVVAELTRAGLLRNAATLAVVMVTRDHGRPEAELLDILRQYAGLEDGGDAGAALQYLKDIGWLHVKPSYGLDLVHQAPDLREQIANKIGRPEAATLLVDLRQVLEPTVRVLGPIEDETVYGSFLDALREAQTEVCMPMLATTPRLSAVPILLDRARHGVRVRILLGSENVVTRLRGETMRSMAHDAIQGWTAHARGIPTMSVRVSDSIEDMIVATCTSIDGCLLRYDVYYPWRQRSLEGVMLEIKSEEPHELNIVRQFKQHFDAAWSRARPTGRWGSLRWFLARGWRWWGFALFGAGTALSSGNLVVASVCGSAAATFLVNAVVDSWPAISERFRRLF